MLGTSIWWGRGCSTTFSPKPNLTLILRSTHTHTCFAQNAIAKSWLWWVRKNINISNSDVRFSSGEEKQRTVGILWIFLVSSCCWFSHFSTLHLTHLTLVCQLHAILLLCLFQPPHCYEWKQPRQREPHETSSFINLISPPVSYSRILLAHTVCVQIWYQKSLEIF